MTLLAARESTITEDGTTDWAELRRRRRALAALREALKVPDLPPEVVSVYRPTAPELADRIVTRILREVTAFATADPFVRSALTEAINRAVMHFVDVLANVPWTGPDVYDFFRRIGNLQGAAGQDLDAMRAAHHIATQESWDDLRRVSIELNLPAETMAQLGDTLFAYQRQLLDQAIVGFVVAKGGAAQQRRESTTRLVVALLSGAAETEVDELAAETGWDRPDEVCVATCRTAGAEVTDLLASAPAVLSGQRRGTLTLIGAPCAVAELAGDITARTGQIAALSWAVPLSDTHHAYRWCKRSLTMVDEGLVAAGEDGVVPCAEHQSLLWMHADPALRRHANQELLRPLFEEQARHRVALAETMLLWLQTRQSAPALAKVLGVHEQTVRYRLRRLKTIFRDQLADPRDVVGLLAALESSAPLWRCKASAS